MLCSCYDDVYDVCVCISTVCGYDDVYDVVLFR
jgi:hypothetical protein